MAEVVLKAVRKSFGKLETIHGIDLAITDKEFVVFVGPSGCGKSTLLRLIAGLEDITSGDLLIDGVRANELTPKERGIAMVFQSYALYPHMTVFENMAFGLELSKVGKAEIEEKVKRAAASLELSHLLDRLPKQLSGGQRQRVAIGRAIVRQPKVFLFDEPLSNLDAALRVQTRIEIARLHEAMGATMVYVTHDQVEAMTLADKIVVLSAGSVEQIGTPLDLYEYPDNLFVAGFIGSPQMNFLDARVAEVGAGGLTLTVQDGTRLATRVATNGVGPGDKVRLGIRPEHLELAEATEPGQAGVLVGDIEVIEDLGESHFIYVRHANGPLLTFRADGLSKLKPHSKIALRLPPACCHVFRENGGALRRQGGASLSAVAS
ncbi:MAG: sn-glycerol-3-phosphate ABC transporter ATP-binding protein UgpC [Ancalomicrobiaceae bacterium]|nr:sn-glycerol-3-phosphate ABC transporter ATP-binding protein UgpC [Ancalomicrobiaceae bacterium]